MFYCAETLVQGATLVT